MWPVPTSETKPLPDQTCKLCGAHSRLIAAFLGVCLDCIRNRPQEALEVADAAHVAARRLFGLPEHPQSTEGGRRCGLCVQDCVIGEGERGYCGLRTVRDGKLRHLAGTPQQGLLHWYRDPLPTNCVADPVCAGHRQRGKHNLAVFYAACTVDCLFCQNYHFRETDPVRSDKLTARQLADAANPHTYCVCYFGGDPAAQMAHALAASRLLAERGIVICWETNGTAHHRLMNRALDLSLATGGCVKFDLKAHDDNLHRAIGYALLSDALGETGHRWSPERPLDRPRAMALIERALALPVEDGPDYDLQLRLRDLRAAGDGSTG